MEAMYSSPKGKKPVNVDNNLGSGWKSPVKLMSPIVHTKTICLHEWWLTRHVKAEGIAVGGFTFRREGLETSFVSAPIVKRHDHTTLQSSDGVTIFISGLIDRFASEKNGFSPEVCSRFITGFPLDWDDFTSQNVSEKSADGSHSFPPGSLQDMPYLQRRDLWLFGHDFSNKEANSEHFFSDLMGKLKPAVAPPDVSHDCDLPSASENLINDLVEKLKPANAFPDVSHDCDLSSAGNSKKSREKGKEDAISENLLNDLVEKSKPADAGKSKKSKETGKDNRASLKLRVRTRSQLRSLEAENRKVEELDTKSKKQKVKAKKSLAF